MLYAEDPVQVLAPSTHEGASFLCRHNRKLAVELGYVMTPEKLIGLVEIRDTTHPQLLRQAALPRPEASLRTAPCLRRISRDHLHSEFLQSAAHLRRAARIHSLTTFRRDKEMPSSIAIQRAEQSFGLDHFVQGGHHSSRAFGFHQLRVVDLTGGVVQDHDQFVIPSVIEPPIDRKSTRLNS